jgi:hypothetical protein
MITRLTLVILGLFHTANGAWMVLAPMSWYAAVPGVAESGPLNHHFVADIGLAFIASGAGLVFGARTGAGAFALAGATWPVLHALLHMWGWLQHGFPAPTKTTPTASDKPTSVCAGNPCCSQPHI